MTRGTRTVPLKDPAVTHLSPTPHPSVIHPSATYHPPFTHLSSSQPLLFIQTNTQPNFSLSLLKILPSLLFFFFIFFPLSPLPSLLHPQAGIFQRSVIQPSPYSRHPSLSRWGSSLATHSRPLPPVMSARREGGKVEEGRERWREGRKDGGR